MDRAKGLVEFDTKDQVLLILKSFRTKIVLDPIIIVHIYFVHDIFGHNIVLDTNTKKFLIEPKAKWTLGCSLIEYVGLTYKTLFACFINQLYKNI